MSTSPMVAALEAAVQTARGMEAPLNDRLRFIADAVRDLSSDFAENVDRMVLRLQQSGAGETAPAPGDIMPRFILPDQDGRLVDLNDILAKGPAVISFNRGHWCPYCRINAQALTEIYEKARAQGASIIAITPERRRFAAALQADANAPFQILTDMDNGYALSLNLVIWVSEDMQQLIAGAGWNLPAFQGNQSWMLPIPATFVVGSDGVIVARDVDPDYRRRMDVDDVLAAIRTAR